MAKLSTRSVRSKVSGRPRFVSQRPGAQADNCRGRIRCADGRCVNSVTQCDLRSNPVSASAARVKANPSSCGEKCQNKCWSDCKEDWGETGPETGDCVVDCIQIEGGFPEPSRAPRGIRASVPQAPPRPPATQTVAAAPAPRVFAAGPVSAHQARMTARPAAIATIKSNPDYGCPAGTIGICDTPVGGVKTCYCHRCDTQNGKTQCISWIAPQQPKSEAPPMPPRAPTRAQLVAPPAKPRPQQAPASRRSVVTRSAPTSAAKPRTATLAANPARLPRWMHAVFGQPVPQQNPHEPLGKICGPGAGPCPPGQVCHRGRCVSAKLTSAWGGVRSSSCSYDDVVERGCTTEIDAKGNIICVCPKKDDTITARPGRMPGAPPAQPKVRPLGTMTATTQARMTPQAQVISSGPISAGLVANPYASSPNPRAGGQMWWGQAGGAPWVWRPPSAPAVPMGSYSLMPAPRYGGLPRRNPVYRAMNPGPDKPIFGQPQAGSPLPPQWFYYQSPTTMGAPGFAGPVAAPGPPPGVFGLGGRCYSDLDCGENEYCHQGICLPRVDPTKPASNPQSNPVGMESQTIPLAPGIALR